MVCLYVCLFCLKGDAVNCDDPFVQMDAVDVAHFEVAFPPDITESRVSVTAPVARRVRRIRSPIGVDVISELL